MRQRTNLLLICLSAIALLLPIGFGAMFGLLASDQGTDTTPTQTETVSCGLSLSEDEVIFNLGSTRQLTASVTEGEGAYIFQWNSSDKSVVSVKKDAEVQESCQLMAEGEGSATVTVSIIDVTKFKVVESVTCAVSVSNEQIEFGVDEVIISLAQGNTATVTAVAPDGGEISWSSEDETIAGVEDGVITAYQSGQVNIVARSGNVESKLPVRIYNSFFTLEDVKIISAGKSGEIAIEGSISGSATWTSGDDRVATVDENGVVRGMKPGMTTVTVTAEEDGLTSVCVIIVASGSDKAIALAEGKKSTAANDPGNWFYLCESEEVTVGAVPTIDNGVICADITGIGDSGSNFFYLRYQPDNVGDVIYKNTTYIYSSADRVPIQVNGKDYELEAGLNRIEMEFTSVAPKDGSPYQIKWKGMGQFYIIPVFEEIGRIEKMTLSESCIVLNTTTDKDAVLTADVPDQGGDEIEWISSNEDVASVVDGVVTAVGEGNSMIIAKCGAFSASCLVTVEGATPISGTQLTSGNKKAALETPGRWLYLKDGKSSLYSNPIIANDGRLHIAIERIDDANKKYVYLRYQPEELKTYKAVITIEFAGVDGTSVDILGGDVGATPVMLQNGMNTVEFTFTADDATPFQFKFYGAGSYVIDVTFVEK